MYALRKKKQYVMLPNSVTRAGQHIAVNENGKKQMKRTLWCTNKRKRQETQVYYGILR